MPRLSLEETAKLNVKRLVDYATRKLYLQDYDAIYVQNILLDALKLTEPSESEVGDYDFYSVMDALSAYAVKKGLIEENEKLLFETKLIGFCMPSPSKVIEMFDDIARYSGTKDATAMLFKLGEDSAYLRRPDLDKNIVWEDSCKRGRIVITINLSKPEKTPEQVRLAKLAKGGYPKCMLCVENLGFAGNAAKPARQNIRIIPFELDGENWFLQYSPYQYFDEHLIAVCEEHRPMCVTDATFRRMLDFLDMFPHYFIGSNAALPIVGGSILAHDHYQGGKKVLPVFERPVRRHFKIASLPEVDVAVVDWYNSIVRISSKNRAQALEAVNRFYKVWDAWDDVEQNILSHTEKDGEKVQHNAITPIASINKDGEYEFNLILRNNRTDEAHPFGIFHPAIELHNIKQESIGIIEVMGLFILPGRLKAEADQMRDILTGKAPLDFEALARDDHPLHKHLGMITQLVVDYGTGISETKASEAITGYINHACEQILDTTAVFKNTEEGQAAFDRFIHQVVGA
ncbi:MAG: galactose-1-phosphate uridylyltransferase [Clostridia bacterium]|nr:galactose-1-phosphate uridylyltransferase [Clostridia bacterium]